MKQVSVSVPGKIMLAGEYSVLSGGRSLSATVRPRLEAQIQLREEDSCFLYSQLWEKSVNVHAPCVDEHEPLLQSALWACKHWQAKGFDLYIDSEFKVTDGFGSSSAVRLASLIALAKSTGRTETPWDLARLTWLQQKKLQGFASGYDLVTQVKGGAVLWEPDYDNWPGTTKTISDSKTVLDHFRIFGGGAGAPTKSVGESTLSWLKSHSSLSHVEEVTDELIEILLQGAHNLGWEPVIKAAAAHRRIFEKSPRFPQFLIETLSAIPGFDETWTFKTTGAGGEDAILLMGSPDNTHAASLKLQQIGWNELMSPWSMDGLRVKY